MYIHIHVPAYVQSILKFKYIIWLVSYVNTDPISYWRQQASLKSVTGDNSLCIGVPGQKYMYTHACSIYTFIHICMQTMHKS